MAIFLLADLLLFGSRSNRLNCPLLGALPQQFHTRSDGLVIIGTEITGGAFAYDESVLAANEGDETAATGQCCGTSYRAGRERSLNRVTTATSERGICFQINQRINIFIEDRRKNLQRPVHHARTGHADDSPVPIHEGSRKVAS